MAVGAPPAPQLLETHMVSHFQISNNKGFSQVTVGRNTTNKTIAFLQLHGEGHDEETIGLIPALAPPSAAPSAAAPASAPAASVIQVSSFKGRLTGFQIDDCAGPTTAAHPASIQNLQPLGMEPESAAAEDDGADADPEEDEIAQLAAAQHAYVSGMQTWWTAFFWTAAILFGIVGTILLFSWLFS